MSNLKISNFTFANELFGADEFPIIRNDNGWNNYRTPISSLESYMSMKFASVSNVASIEDAIGDLETNITVGFGDLRDEIRAGDQAVVSNLTATIVSYYDVLNNKIVQLEVKHNHDISTLNVTMQDWINVIDGKANSTELTSFDNRLTTAENLLTQLAEIVYDYKGGTGGGGSGTPGYHTQSTSTIFPLTGYYRTGSTETLTPSDTLNQALGKLESRVYQIEQNGGGGGTGVYLIRTGDITSPTDGNAYSALRANQEFISAKNDDIAEGYVKFTKGIQGGQVFTPGFLGSGASLYPVENKWNLEVDNLFVRGSAQFNELVVNEIKAIGGDLLITVADMAITLVETIESEGVYRCYFDNQDGTILNKFVALDQAICQKFDGHNAKRYWRLVSAVGVNYVDLSINDAEPGSAIPESGDILIQLGNRTNEARRSAIMLSAVSSSGPQIALYENITTFDLTNKQRTTIGRESKFVGTIYQTTNTGDIVQVPRDLGQFVVGNTYYYYDRVSYNGSLWLCVATMTTDAPDETRPDVWQLQVSKGSAGQTGSDVGQWLEIMGQSLFIYPEPNFGGTPNPTVLNQSANAHNITDPTFTWRILETNQIVSAAASCQVTPEQFADFPTITLQCTAVSIEGTFTDEMQLAKLTNGATGENAVYIALSNDNVSVLYSNDGQNPLIDLTSVNTTILAYVGTTQVEPTNISYTVVNGTASLTLVHNLLTLTSLTTNTARVRISVEIEGATFSRDMWITKIFNGPSGADGADAAYVVLTGEQTFKVNPNLTISPESITLTAVPYNIPNPSYQWAWSISGENNWSVITGETGNTYVVMPTGLGFDTGADEISFRCLCRAEYGSVDYTDVVTINKLHDGKDGETIYYGILSNENQTVTAEYNGTVSSTNTSKVTSSYKMFYGTTELTYGTDYTIRIIQPDATNTSTMINDSDQHILQLASLSATHDVTVFKIEFIDSTSRVVDVVDFTISKSKNGAPGDYEVAIYAYKTSAPSRPTFNYMPSAVGVAGPDGTMWYTTIPAGTPIYMCKATFDGLTGLATVNSEGNYWTTPTPISGTPGATGATGDRGPAGATGATGPTGPGLVYKGKWTSGTYYKTDYQADVVYYEPNSTYYVRKTMGSTTTTPTNSTYWQSLNSFANIATGMLFAGQATIAGWNFSDNYIWSQDRRCYLDGAGGTKNTPVISLGENSMSTSLVPSQTAKIRMYSNGTIVVGEGDGNDGNAGIAGEHGNGNSSIRFWAGATLGNRYNAPFMVTHGGNVTANNATITGKFQTGVSGSRFIINSTYSDQYFRGYDGSGNLVISMDSGTSPYLTLTRNSLDKSSTILRGGYAYYYSPNQTYMAVSGWENYGTTFQLGPTTAGRWPTSANGGRIWRDSNGFLKAS